MLQALILLLAGAAGSPAWLYSERAALQAAAAQRKPLFVFARTDYDLLSRWVAERELADPNVRAQLPHYVCAQWWVGAKLLRKERLTNVGFVFFEPDGRLLSALDADCGPARLAAELAEARRRVGARTRLELQLKAAPRDAGLLKKLIEECARRRDEKTACALYDRLAKERRLTESESAERDFLRLRLKLRAKDYAAAASLGEAFLRAHPASPRLGEAALAGAGAYQARGRLAEAVSLLARALNAQPDAKRGPELALAMARLRRAAGQTVDARRTMNMLLIRWPASAAAAQVKLSTARRLWLEEGDSRAAGRVLARLLSCPEAPYLAEMARAMEARMAAEPRWVQTARTVPPAARAVVLAPDAASFLRCVAMWTRRRVFPVLFDEPKFARKFIDAYQPEQVLLVRRAPGARADAALARRAAQAGLGADQKPPAAGVVVSSPDSPALPAAAALAAGRGETLLLAPSNLAPRVGTASADAKDRLRGWLERELRRRGLAFERLGDDVDFITIAAAWPERYAEPKGVIPGVRALDDALGRRRDGRRYAFVGRLNGDAAQAAYQAMAALFLRPRSALLFNTYSQRPGSIWRSYNMESAEKRLSPFMTVKRLARPHATLAAWHALAFPECPFGLVWVNSSGGRSNWSVPGGQGTTDDVPDAAACFVHFTHSNSAGAVNRDDCIAGRWLANGAYAFFGSLAEPYLSAFVPPTELSARVSRGWPASAACRRFYGEPFWTPWRLWLIGDPLASPVRPAARRAAGDDVPGRPIQQEIAALRAAAADPAGDVARTRAALAARLFQTGEDAEAAAVAARIDWRRLDAARRGPAQYVWLASLLRRGKTAEAERVAKGLGPENLGRDARLMQRAAVMAQLQAALAEKRLDAAMRRLRALAPAAANGRLFARSVRALRPLCRTPAQRAALAALCRDIERLRPKDKRLHGELEKALNPKPRKR